MSGKQKMTNGRKFFLFNCIEPQWGMNDTGWGELESKTSFHTMKKVNKTYSHMSDTGELTGLREQNTFKKKKKSITQLTDHKDGECVVYWCITVGGLKGINSTLWHFQSHQPELTAVTKHKENLQHKSIHQFLRNISKNVFFFQALTDN